MNDLGCEMNDLCGEMNDLFSEMNMSEYICICLAFPSSGIFLNKPLEYKNVR